MKMAESYSNGWKNTVGKGEIAHYEQFLLFPRCFQKACFPGASKGVIVWEWVKVFEELTSENLVGTVDNASVISIFSSLHID